MVFEQPCFFCCFGIRYLLAIMCTGVLLKRSFLWLLLMGRRHLYLAAALLLKLCLRMGVFFLLRICSVLRGCPIRSLAFLACECVVTGRRSESTAVRRCMVGVFAWLCVSSCCSPYYDVAMNVEVSSVTQPSPSAYSFVCYVDGCLHLMYLASPSCLFIHFLLAVSH